MSIPPVTGEAVTIGSANTTKALILEVRVRAIITGADDWSSGWTLQADGSCLHTWPYTWGMQPILNGWADYWNWDGNGYKRDVLRRSEMVYVNGLPLRGVLAQGELSAAGTFYVDEGRSRIFMRPPTGVSPPSATVEVGVRLTAVAVNGRNNVTLRNLAVMRNRGAVQQGAALQADNLQNLTLDGVRIQFAAATGLGTARHRRTPDSRLKISDNGIVGHNDYRSRNALVQGVEVA